MCGIAGKVSFTSKNITLSGLGLLSLKLSHRGPDDAGVYTSPDKKIGLVHRRLSIIDLSNKGHQPMSYARGRYWIVFNGEIYNFQTEKKKLEKLGYKFKSRTDTEVILALYDRHGTSCLKHLRGMFAFAIYDDYKKTLFLARDRLGKKPLKYYYSCGVFIFSSELKAIITQPEVSISPDWEAIHHYLTFGYTPSPYTGFSNIHKLEPGHFILLDIARNKLVKNCYWRPDYSKQLKLDEKEWQELILEKLDESVKLRMVSDVPLGVFLSGGVDSSAVVASMSKFSRQPIKTFTIGYKEEKYDERIFADSVSKMFNTEHEVLMTDIKDLPGILPDLVYQYEEPYANASSMVLSMVSQLAKKKVTVVLNGDGGDENFAGYDRHIRFGRDAQYGKYFSYLPKLALNSSEKIVEFLNNKNITKLFRYANKMTSPLSDIFVDYRCYLNNSEKEKLYCKDFFESQINASSYAFYKTKFSESNVKDLRNQSLYADMVSYLPDDLLTKVDIASMACGLEARSPLLDQEMVELACKIPYDLKVKNKEGKYIFKKALEKLLPKEILYRPKKGFSIPLYEWFLGDMKKYSKSVLFARNSLSRKYFNQDYILHMYKSHGGGVDYAPQLWSILTLELWYKRFFL